MDWSGIRAKVRELMFANGFIGALLIALKSMGLWFAISAIISVISSVIMFPVSFVLGLFGDSLPNSVIMIVTTLMGFAIFVIVFSVMSLLMIGVCATYKNFVLEGNLEFKYLFSALFSDNRVLIIKTLALVMVKTYLLTLICVIPGLLYSMKMIFVPFILTENPDMSPKDICALSAEMSNGYKMQYFINGCLCILPWSFLASLLSCCTLTLSVWLLMTYVYGILAAFYVLRLQDFNGN